LCVRIMEYFIEPSLHNMVQYGRRPVVCGMVWSISFCACWLRIVTWVWLSLLPCSFNRWVASCLYYRCDVACSIRCIVAVLCAFCCGHCSWILLSADVLQCPSYWWGVLGIVPDSLSFLSCMGVCFTVYCSRKLRTDWCWACCACVVCRFHLVGQCLSFSLYTIRLSST